ncbi:hypothetical protein LDO32_10985 [Luteimonas sp. Y-2-2-4F]|nr:hypothetical protein [Luteimonas sp. Y-2-2-4F]MCD9032248.1 hypothetical protein [Luteimonas sp. Y-2-2-4F]
MSKRPSSRMPPRLAAVLLSSALAAGCALSADRDPSGTSSMSEPTTTTVEAAGGRLTASFAYTPRTGAVEVHYRFDNVGESPLAVFDRGDRHAVLVGRQHGGAVGAPHFQEEAPGDVVLRHAARPLPEPPPTVPPTPLAARVEPGASLAGEFLFAPPTEREPQRIRWCLGVAPFDTEGFTQPEEVDGVEVWRGSFDLAARQTLLCTPWFDVAAQRFEAG